MRRAICAKTAFLVAMRRWRGRTTLRCVIRAAAPPRMIAMSELAMTAVYF